MAAAVTVNDLLDGHVALDVECLDRIYPLSELLCRSSLFTSRAVMRADMFAVHDRTGPAAGPAAWPALADGQRNGLRWPAASAGGAGRKARRA